MFKLMRGLQFNLFCFCLAALSILFCAAEVSARESLEGSTFRQKISNYCKVKSEKTCRSPMDESKLRLADVDAVLSCQDYFKRNNCEDVKSSLQNHDRGLVISCEPNQICRDSAALDVLQCSYDGMVSQIKFSNLALIFGGTISSSVYSLAGVPVSILAFSILVYDESKSAQACDADIKYKKLAIRMHNLTLFENEKALDVEGKDKAILKMPCSDLNAFLKNRLDVLSERRSQEKLWNPNAHEYRQSPVALAMLKSLKSNRCLNTATIAKEACRSLAGLLTDIGLGAATQVLSHAAVSHFKSSPNESVEIEAPNTASSAGKKFTNWFRGHVENIWSPNTPKNIKDAVRAFRQKQKLPNGTIYGESVREIKDIQGLSPVELDKNLVAHGFEKHHSVIHDPVTHAPVLDAAGHEIPMDVYTHPDGGMVRVKPIGDPTQKFRPQPLASKAVRTPASAPYDDFNYEAFKVDKNGLPLPKWAPDINNPFQKNTPEAREFLDGWADAIHFDLAH